MATIDTKEHLIKVARRLFAQQGIGNITMNDIAQAANKSRRTLYTYFQSKEELLEASIEMEVMKISAAMTKVAMSTLPPNKKIIKLIFTRLQLTRSIVRRNGCMHNDYFVIIEHIRKSFDAKEIERNITPQKYELYFGSLSDKQEEIVSDSESKCVVVAAGPGSGKTKLLVHKLASLYQLEDVKHEQMLMLTFSRAAATEFKKRLQSLIGNAANFIEIKTFHSYCFDLLGKVGSLESSKDVVKNATDAKYYDLYMTQFAGKEI